MEAAMFAVEPDRPSSEAQVPPDRIQHHDLIRYRTAQRHALAIYPGIVGQVLAAEIATFTDFGFRMDQSGRIPRLVDHLMTHPLP